jgi:hypothetical protein
LLRILKKIRALILIKLFNKLRKDLNTLEAITLYEKLLKDYFGNGNVKVDKEKMIRIIENKGLCLCRFRTPCPCPQSFNDLKTYKRCKCCLFTIN